jgi:DNA excision repair protein ERCC-2
LEKKINISVRALVEFVLRSGDIDMRFTGSQRMLDGTKAHKRIQKASPEEYKPEVTLTYTFEYRGFEIKLDGRADGVIYSSSGIVVDEIKSTTYPLENIEDNHNPLHWAQAKCYAFMLARQQTLESVDVQLTYCTLEDDGIKQFRRTFTEYELTYFIYELFDKYIVWAEYESERIKKRDLNIKTLNFPFECYRIGQRELAAATYRAIVGGVQLFAQAPTGVGKTISTLFPAVKAIGEGQAQKIFYLTAKTITRQAAHDAFLKMRGLGSYFKAVTLTAKDKICPHPGTPCNPEHCELARGYYDRVNDVLLSLLENESLITREIITAYAEKNKLCPFELSLDMSLS